MRIERFNSSRLREFLASEEYRTMPYIPVSEHRALSWLQNPRMEPGDVIMYLGYKENQMVAYRCILPDRIGDERFGWLSGIWVRPDCRRQGFASMLFEEALSDWGHHLMYTNYAPEAKSLLDKSGRFDLYHLSPGLRYYQRSAAAGLLGNRSLLFRRSRPLLRLADGVLNAVQGIRTGFFPYDSPEAVIEESVKVDSEAMDFLEKNHGTGFCNRMQVDFDWICGYSWIEPGPQRDGRYFFSSYAPVFKNIILKIRTPDGEMGGFLWMVVNGEKMTLPYMVFSPATVPQISPILNHYLQKHKISYLTTYQAGLINIYRPGPILGRRKIYQHIFATHELLKQLPRPGTVQFQDGDGDVAFV